MNTHSILDAKEVINSYSESDLAKVFYEYGEIKQSRRIAKKIIDQREERDINTTFDFINILEGLYSKRMRNKFLSRIFQAIRIEVNDEINALKDLLDDVGNLLNNKGRLVVISYHSLEDRLVKNLINKGNIAGYQEKDLYGRINKDLDPINKKVIIPENKECEENPRARSAKLRIAEKI
jgi:16S rRNA (cytosine1402-N4)-methyltransferase